MSFTCLVMRLLCYLVLVGVPVFLVSCKEPVLSDAPTSYLKTMTEFRYTPNDSLTITYQYDQHGRLEREERRLPLGSTSIVDLYDPNEPTSQIYTSYRLHSYSGQNQKVSVKYYYSVNNTRLLFDSDSLIYEGNQLAGQEHRDYFFQVDGGQYAFDFPLWLTKRTFLYNAQNQIESETDSVFITHDISDGTTVLTKASATYLHTNKTTYTYDEKGMVSQSVAVSGDQKRSLRYSNGWEVLDSEGKGYASSIRMRFVPGTTTYSYDYNSDGQLIQKTATYSDGQNSQPYVSTFRYEYDVAN